jgi:predicted nuclease with TOPRIM domain
MAKNPFESEQIIRVQMNREQLNELIQPLLDEINSLRARVADLEDTRESYWEWRSYLDDDGK